MRRNHRVVPFCMRGLLLAALAGCGFEITVSTAPVDVGAPVIDGPADASVGDRCGGKLWFTDFSADPTAFDNNGDAIKDFSLRDNSVFPTNQLVGGEWVTPGSSLALDTRPPQPFTTRTIINVKMRSTTTSGTKGAVFWINAGYATDTRIALYVELKRSSNTAQTFKLINQVGSNDIELTSIPGLPITPIVIELDLDPTTMSVKFSANGTTGMRNLSRTDGSPNDRWATVVGYDSAAAFDELRVEVCP